MRYLLCLGMLLSLLACAEKDVPAATVHLEPQRLEELRGQWVVINYWASWCKPCIEEIPQLNALDREYDRVTVLGVNYDGASGADLEQQRQQLGVDFALLAMDPAAQLGTSRPVVLPTTLILDPDGQLVATLLGPQTLESLVLATQQPWAGNVQ
ncbi:MAG TPA: TlpA disulfide reductase family protein [Halioglobus sp.]